MNHKTALWRPDKVFKRNSNILAYSQWLENKEGLDFESYEDLWEWSVDHPATFWTTLFDYFDLEYDGSTTPAIEGVMPRVAWFSDIQLNYVERIFSLANEDEPAIIWKTERADLQMLTWRDVKKKVADVQQHLIQCGVEPGDRVAAYLPNIPEASIAFLATVGLGGVWSSCSPDFGVDSVIDRFQQIEPKVFIGLDGYSYNGKEYDKRADVKAIFERLPLTEHMVMVPVLDLDIDGPGCLWGDIAVTNLAVQIKRLPFAHPIWILYSSGTTGAPKAITHSHGGVLLEHLKYISFHNDVHAGERFFWYSTTGWMMWNFVHASWLVGATVVLYDGSAAYPSLNAMWRFVSEARIHHFGTSAPFIVGCMKRELSPGSSFNLSELRSIGSTGSPLPPEGFEWIYEQVKDDVWLCSMSGGTDVCTAFVGGCPILPVYMGEIQCRTLGCALYAWDDFGNHADNRVGEMVITKPMPSMPIYFWNDADFKRYTASYFEDFPGVWRHGDWVEVTSRGSLIIYGRSDATLNRHGIRIGTSEIYRALHDIEELSDSLVVNLELAGGQHYMPLFVKLDDGHTLTDALKDKIKKTLRSTYTPRHVPDEIILVDDIPYTISGKKMEAPIKKLLMGMDASSALNKGAMRNPESLAFFEAFGKRINR